MRTEVALTGVRNGFRQLTESENQGKGRNRAENHRRSTGRTKLVISLRTFGGPSELEVT